MGIEIGSVIGSVASGVARGAPSIAIRTISSFGKVLSPVEKTGGFLPGFTQLGVENIKTPSVGGLFKPEESLNLGKPARPRLNTAEVISEAESIISQAQKRSLRLLGEPTAKPAEKLKPEVIEPSWTPRVEQVGKSKTELVNIFHRRAKAKKLETISSSVNTEVPQAKPKILVFPRVVPSWEPVIKPKEEPEVQAVAKTANQPRTENQTISKTTQEVFTQSFPKAQEQEEAKEIEEIVEEKVKKEAEDQLEEQEVEGKEYLVDEEALEQRKKEIKQAIIKARSEANRLGLEKIAGWLIAKFLPTEHEGNRSQVIKKRGPDGSYQETVEAVSITGELESEEKAVDRFYKVVGVKTPVKIGKEGKRVKLEDVARVFKYRFVKAVQLVKQVIARVVKKKSNLASPKQAIIEPIRLVTKPGSIIETLGLTKVFSKAA